jgi:hypothetical protein
MTACFREQKKCPVGQEFAQQNRTEVRGLLSNVENQLQDKIRSWSKKPPNIRISPTGIVQLPKGNGEKRRRQMEKELKILSSPLKINRCKSETKIVGNTKLLTLTENQS